MKAFLALIYKSFTLALKWISTALTSVGLSPVVETSLEQLAVARQ